MEKNNFLLRTTDKHKNHNYCYDIDGDGDRWIKIKCSDCELGIIKTTYNGYHIICTATELCEYG